MVLSHLLYISDAAHPMSRGELEAIRSAAMKHNARLGITGDGPAGAWMG